MIKNFYEIDWAPIKEEIQNNKTADIKNIHILINAKTEAVNIPLNASERIMSEFMGTHYVENALFNDEVNKAFIYFDADGKTTDDPKKAVRGFSFNATEEDIRKLEKQWNNDTVRALDALQNNVYNAPIIGVPQYVEETLMFENAPVIIGGVEQKSLSIMTTQAVNGQSEPVFDVKRATSIDVLEVGYITNFNYTNIFRHHRLLTDINNALLALSALLISAQWFVLGVVVFIMAGISWAVFEELPMGRKYGVKAIPSLLKSGMGLLIVASLLLPLLGFLATKLLSLMVFVPCIILIVRTFKQMREMTLKRFIKEQD